jgi:hypothetical protein
MEEAIHSRIKAGPIIFDIGIEGSVELSTLTGPGEDCYIVELTHDTLRKVYVEAIQARKENG